jgi:hypothetical protein
MLKLECFLDIVLGDTKDGEGWLEVLMRIDYNGITTKILLIKLRIKKRQVKETIERRIKETMKRIEIIEDAIEKGLIFSNGRFG